MACLNIISPASSSKKRAADAQSFSYIRNEPPPCLTTKERCRQGMRVISLQASSSNLPYFRSSRFVSGDMLKPKARTPYDVVGLGEAMVDYSGMVSTEFLEETGLEPGCRRVVSVEERAQTIDELEGHNLQLNAGGSLANTLSGIAVLAQAAHDANPSAAPPPRIGMAGCIGSDTLGSFFQQQMEKSGVQWVGKPQPDTATGTVVVLTTPDAQRSFLSLPGTGVLHMCPGTATGLACSRIMMIEGYLWEMPEAEEAIFRAIALARAAGSIVVMTAADVSVVNRHRTAMLRAAAAADLLFSNAEEARALVGTGMPGGTHPELSSREALSGKRPVAEEDCLQLGKVCPMVVVTRGSAGSCVSALGQLHVVPPHWAEDAPVDTCGAGDAFAAGFVHAYLRGCTVRQMGEFGAMCASSVLGRQSPRLEQEDASSLVATLQSTLQGSSSAVGVNV